MQGERREERGREEQERGRGEERRRRGGERRVERAEACGLAWRGAQRAQWERRECSERIKSAGRAQGEERRERRGERSERSGGVRFECR